MSFARLSLPVLPTLLAAYLFTVALPGCAHRSTSQAPVTPTAAPTTEAPMPKDADREPLALFGDRSEADPAFCNRLLSNIAQHSFTADGRDFDPDVDHAGELLVFASTRHADNPDLYIKQVDSTALTQLTSDPAHDVQPRFSPDGRKIAFASNRGGTWDIWQINRDGTNLVQLTSDVSDELSPSWSPDGSLIAYSVWSQRSGTWEIWTLAVDRPGVKRFLAAGMFPVWSPDGKRLAFQRARQRGSRWFSVWTVELLGDEARNPTEVAHSDEAACIAPQWSPDGRWLVYCAVSRSATSPPRTNPAADLWAVALDSGVRRKLTDGGAPSMNPVWSRAGRIFFVSDRAGTENIWSVPGGMIADSDGPRVTRTSADGRSAP